MKRKRTAITIGAIAALVIAVMPFPGRPAAAITRSDVEAACQDSSAALAAYEKSQARFAEVALELDQTSVAVQDNSIKLDRTESLVARQEATVDELQAALADQADELYMQAVSAPTFLLLGSPEDIIMASSVLETSSVDGLSAVNDVTSARSDLQHYSNELSDVATELADLQAGQTDAVNLQQAAMVEAGQAYDQLSEECREAKSQFEAELARQRELERRRDEERARREAEAQAAAAAETTIPRSDPPADPEPIEPPPTVNGFLCPMTPGQTQFIDSWGFPRSGGRTHQGTDMMAPWDEPVFAVESGVIDADSGGIGGNNIWLAGDSGTGYYYAHLNGFAVSDGARVGQGDLVGYNGATGNAAGGAPHVHFQLHPGGGSPINPYPTLAAACF